LLFRSRQFGQPAATIIARRCRARATSKQRRVPWPRRSCLPRKPSDPSDGAGSEGAKRGGSTCQDAVCRCQPDGGDRAGVAASGDEGSGAPSPGVPAGSGQGGEGDVLSAGDRTLCAELVFMVHDRFDIRGKIPFEVLKTLRAVALCQLRRIHRGGFSLQRQAAIRSFVPNCAPRLLPSSRAGRQCRASSFVRGRARPEFVGQFFSVPRGANANGLKPRELIERCPGSPVAMNVMVLVVAFVVSAAPTRRSERKPRWND